MAGRCKVLLGKEQGLGCCGTGEGPCVDLFSCHAALNLARFVTLFSPRLAEGFLSEETFSILEFSGKLQAQCTGMRQTLKDQGLTDKSERKKVRRFAPAGPSFLL